MKKLLFSIILVLSFVLSPLTWAGSSDPVIEGKSATDINIDGGAIDSTPIGSGTPQTGAFTTLGTTGDVTVGTGGDPADAGAFRLKNADKIVWEASPAGADIEGIAVDANEVVQIGAAGASGVTITPAVTLSAGTSVNEFSTDGTLAGDSDDAVPTEKAVKTYADTKAILGANADITSMTALTQITRATGGVFDIAIGGAAGDDFTVDTDKLVVEGDTGKVGIGIAAPSEKLEVQGVIMQNGTGTQRMIVKTTGSEISGIRLKVDAKEWEFQHRGDIADKLYLSYYNGVNTTSAMTMDISGNVGILTTAPGNPLAINRSGDGIIVDFESADVVEGNVSIAGNTTSYNAFVGSHYTQLKSGQKELPVGAVVISTGEIIPCEANIEKETKEETEIFIENAFEDVEVEEDGEQIGEEFDHYEIQNEEVVEIKKPVYKKIKKIKRQLKASHALNSKTGKIIKTIITKQNISPDVSGKEYFVYIDTTNQVGDKKVYGVWFGKMADDAKGMSFGSDNKPVYLVAQVGLFKIRVTDTNGNIEVGDFLETSIRPMEARKQTESQRLNSTIAKAMVDVDWSKVAVDSVLGYKWSLIPCVF